MPTAQASTGNRPDSRWQKKKSRQLLDLVKRCLIPRIGQWCDAVAGGCSLSCSPRSHRSLLLLGSSQWQRAFTAQLTYAACLHPAGVSHPDEHISPPDALFFFFSRGLERGGYFGTDQAFSISFDSSLGYLRSGLIISRGVRNDDDHK